MVGRHYNTIIYSSLDLYFMKEAGFLVTRRQEVDGAVATAIGLAGEAERILPTHLPVDVTTNLEVGYYYCGLLQRAQNITHIANLIKHPKNLRLPVKICWL